MPRVCACALHMKADLLTAVDPANRHAPVIMQGMHTCQCTHSLQQGLVPACSAGAALHSDEACWHSLPRGKRTCAHSTGLLTDQTAGDASVVVTTGFISIGAGPAVLNNEVFVIGATSHASPPGC